jgi:DNA (cytosine-5)-methyltransferase 1
VSVFGLDKTIAGVDLFSGPGGLTLGLKKAGVHPICSVEISEDAVATYRNHTSDCEHHCADIRTVDFSRYRGSADILYGGPPCQPFSTGGLRQGKSDRRDMIPAFLAAVDATRPAVVLMENVPGLLVQDRRPYFNRALEELCHLGYRPTWRLLSAADYGVPQKRRRVFIVAFRDRVFRFPKPTHGPDGVRSYVTAGSVVKAEPYGEPPKCPVWYAPNVDIRPSPYAGHQLHQGL